MNAKKRRAPVDRIRIKHGEDLRATLGAVANRLGGSRKAAKQLGLVHSTFNRLLTGAVKTSMTLGTHDRIRGALLNYAFQFQDGAIHELASAFEDALESRHRYGWGEVQHKYQEWLDAELRRLEGVARPVFDELWKSPKYREVIAHHLKKATRHPELPRSDQKRLWLALYRAVEPLTASAVTWGVERSWSELQDDERRAYLDHALSRERIMLAREGDRERMTLRPPPEEWWEEYFRQIEAVPAVDPVPPDHPTALLLKLDAEKEEGGIDD